MWPGVAIIFISTIVEVQDFGFFGNDYPAAGFRFQVFYACGVVRMMMRGQCIGEIKFVFFQCLEYDICVARIDYKRIYCGYNGKGKCSCHQERLS